MLLDKPDNTDYQIMTQAIIAGRLVPFLGAGVNLCGRPVKLGEWCEGSGHLPSGDELSRHLADKLRYPPTNEYERSDLLRVAQYIFAKGGKQGLYDPLHYLLDFDYPITPLHQFLVSLPETLDKKSSDPHYPMIVTTNYDDVLERAFIEARQKFDLVCYEASGRNKGKFWHLPFNETTPVLIDDPSKYLDLPFNGIGVNLTRTVILKIHGAVNRQDPYSDSFVITEDDYIDYSSRSTNNFIPRQLQAKLQRSQFLFMGYSLRDWNLRVILNRIWEEQRGESRSWAIQVDPSDIDVMFWGERKVKIFDMHLEEFVAAMNARM